MQLFRSAALRMRLPDCDKAFLEQADSFLFASLIRWAVLALDYGAPEKSIQAYSLGSNWLTQLMKIHNTCHYLHPVDLRSSFGTIFEEKQISESAMLSGR